MGLRVPVFYSRRKGFEMSLNDRFGAIEWDDVPSVPVASVPVQESPAPKPVQVPVVPAFAPVSGSLRVAEGARAEKGRDGVWRNAIGLESTEAHRHVAKVWQDNCTTMPALRLSLEAGASGKRDQMVPERLVRLIDAETVSKAGVPVRMTEHALDALRGFTDVPSAMASWFRANGLGADLAGYINRGLENRSDAWASKGKEERSFFLRLRKDKDGSDIVRAVCSERYGVIDNLQAFNMLESVLPDEAVLVSHLEDDGDDLFANLLLPDRMQSLPDSDYGVGVAFRNSEVRNGTLEVSPFIFRAICLNGMIWGQAMGRTVNKRHIGQVDMRDIRAQVADAVGEALGHGVGMIRLLDMSKQVKVADPVATIAAASRELKLTIPQGKAWHKAYEETLQERTGHFADRTAFGIVNGLTRAAQGYRGSDRANMEAQASVLLAPAIDADLQAIQRKWARIESNASALDRETVKAYQYIAR